jgi:hypothetical protein
VLLSLDRRREYWSKILDDSLEELLDCRQVLLELDLISFVDGMSGLQVFIGLRAISRDARIDGEKSTYDECPPLVVQKHTVVKGVESECPWTP